MRAILVNPYKREVTLANWDGSLDHAYRLLSEPNVHPVDTVAVVHIARDIAVYVDDNGLCAPGRAVFHPPWGDATPVAGRALITGYNPDTEDHVDMTFPVDEVRQSIVFSPARTTGKFEPPKMSMLGNIPVISMGSAILSYSKGEKS